LVKRQLLSLKTVFLCLLPAALWLLLRWHVYGDILPNTFYAKSTGNMLDQIVKGMLYAVPVMLPLLAMWLLWWQDKNQSVMIALGMVSMLLGIVLLGGGDWMFHFRLLVPLYGILLAVIAAQWQSVSNIKKLMLVLSLIPFFMLVVPPKYAPLIVQGKPLPAVDYQEGTMTHVSLDVAAAIKTRYPNARLIAVNHAGALPWALPEYSMIDMVGLNDAHIAKTEGQLHKKFDVAYVLDMKPDLIILNSRVKPGTDGLWYHKGYWSGEDALVEHPGFAHYQPTDLVFPWHWHVPYPYSLVVRNAETSWILVFERKH
jgi:arabinofuranosyltransferase